jgi:hypothetical protein
MRNYFDYIDDSTDDDYYRHDTMDKRMLNWLYIRKYVKHDLATLRFYRDDYTDIILFLVKDRTEEISIFNAKKEEIKEMFSNLAKMQKKVCDLEKSLKQINTQIHLLNECLHEEKESCS